MGRRRGSVTEKLTGGQVYSMHLLKVLLLTFLLSNGCSSFPLNYEVLHNGTPENTTLLESSETILYISNNESHIKFTCTAKRKGTQENPDAPSGLLAGICVREVCYKNSLGMTADVSIWSTDFNLLEGLKNVYCFGYVPEWFTLNILDRVEERFPEKKIIVTRHPVKVVTKEIRRKEYCNQVDEQGNCLNWY